MSQIEHDKLLRSFMERREEADRPAREVLDEFIRLAKQIPPDSAMWNEVISLDQSWRDTLSDSQVIKYLRALQPNNGRKRAPRR
jgi:hypothetical protein